MKPPLRFEELKPRIQQRIDDEARPREMKPPLRFEEFRRELKQRIQQRVEEMDSILAVEGIDPRPLAPMTLDEATQMIKLYGTLATERVWTREEQFIFEQLIAVLVQAAQAYAKGYQGRWFFLSEEQIFNTAKGKE